MTRYLPVLLALMSCGRGEESSLFNERPAKVNCVSDISALFLSSRLTEFVDRSELVEQSEALCDQMAANEEILTPEFAPTTSFSDALFYYHDQDRDGYLTSIELTDRCLEGITSEKEELVCKYYWIRASMFAGSDGRFTREEWRHEHRSSDKMITRFGGARLYHTIMNIGFRSLEKQGLGEVPLKVLLRLKSLADGIKGAGKKEWEKNSDGILQPYMKIMEDELQISDVDYYKTIFRHYREMHDFNKDGIVDYDEILIFIGRK